MGIDVLGDVPCRFLLCVEVFFTADLHLGAFLSVTGMYACVSVCRQVVRLLGRCIRSWSTSTEDPTEWELETFSKVTSSPNMESSSSQSTTDSEFSVSYMHRCYPTDSLSTWSMFVQMRSRKFLLAEHTPLCKQRIKRTGRLSLSLHESPNTLLNHMCIYSKYTEKMTISVYPVEASLTETGLIRLLNLCACTWMLRRFQKDAKVVAVGHREDCTT